jgi:hypothetical protein
VVVTLKIGDMSNTFKKILKHGRNDRVIMVSVGLKKKKDRYKWLEAVKKMSICN